MKKLILIAFILRFFCNINLIISQESKKNIASPEEEIVAVINGENITKSEFEKRLFEQYGKAVLNQMMDEKLIMQAAGKEGIRITEDELNNNINDMKKGYGSEESFNRMLQQNNFTIDDVKRQIKFNLISNRLMSVLKIRIEAESTISDDELMKFYENNKYMFEYTPSIIIRHILLKSKTEAEDILKKINAGANFSELAKKLSLDESSKDEGGEIEVSSQGWLRYNEFNQALSTLKPGEVSGIVKTEAGYHIIMKDKPGEKRSQKFEEIKEKLIDIYLQQKVQDTFSSFIKDLKENAKIELNIYN